MPPAGSAYMGLRLSPTALLPAQTVSCAGCHSHERNFLCNHGACIIHSSQVLPWQTTTSALILQRQHSSFTKCLCRIIMARNAFWLLRHIHGKAEIYQNICLSYSLLKQLPVKNTCIKNCFLVFITGIAVKYIV